MFHRQLGEQDGEHAQGFGGDLFVCCGFWRASQQQHKFAALVIAVGGEPGRGFAQRAAVDLFECFGEFARQYDLPLGAEYRQQVVDTFDDTVRRFVKCQRGDLLAQGFQRAFALAGFGRQKAVEQELRLGEAAGGKRSDGCLLYTSPSPRDATLSRMPSSA